MIRGFRLYTEDPHAKARMGIFVVKVFVNVVLADYREVMIIRSQVAGITHGVDMTVVSPRIADLSEGRYIVGLVSDLKGHLIVTLETPVDGKQEVIRTNPGVADCISHHISDLSVKALIKL